MKVIDGVMLLLTKTLKCDLVYRQIILYPKEQQIWGVYCARISELTILVKREMFMKI